MILSQSKTTKSGLKFKDFEDEIDGKKVHLYLLTNTNGIEVTFTNYGQRLVSLLTPDKNEKLDDIVLGYPTLEKYLKGDQIYFGAIIGRYANRIAKGIFKIEETSYKLATNNAPNHLHGGPKGLHNVVWDTNQLSTNQIEFSYQSKHMEEGYPGNLNIKVTYTLTVENELKIEYTATTDQATIVNLTHHSYFNLKGEGKGSILDHEVMINAEKYLPIDSHGIPIKLTSVDNTAFDFRKTKKIAVDIAGTEPQLKITAGYDHNFVLKETASKTIILAAKVTEPKTGRILEVYTDKPGLQFFTGNNTVTKLGAKNDHNYNVLESFCLEPQLFPDTPNQPEFPSAILKPGEQYNSTTIFKFLIEK